MAGILENPITQKPLLKVGRKTPFFTLPSTGGGVGGPGFLRSKYDMVLLFLDSSSDAERYLSAFTEAYSEVLALKARALGIVRASLEEASALQSRLGLPFPLLADESGATTTRMLGDRGNVALCVADRYGQVYSLDAAPSPAQLPPPQSALDWLEFIEIQCPE
jgi:peroxiredoxin